MLELGEVSEVTISEPGMAIEKLCKLQHADSKFLSTSLEIQLKT